MNRNALEEDLRRAANGSSFISQHQLRKWMGQRYTSMKELVEGLDYIKSKRTIEYFVGDVADRVMARREQ